MKITIGYLFYDLLNLYGESGNIIALKQSLELQGINANIVLLSMNNDKWKLQAVDFIYMGAGTESNQKLALECLKEHIREIKKAIDDNKFFLITGNSIELFGNYIKYNQEKVQTLGIFDYYTERTKNRLVAECIFNLNNKPLKILGFENHQGITKNVKNPMFTVEKGFGSEIDTGTEGFVKNNFYATYLLGPLLVRNPELLESICKKLILSIDSEFKFKEFEFAIEKKAYNETLHKYN